MVLEYKHIVQQIFVVVLINDSHYPARMLLGIIRGRHVRKAREVRR